MFTGIIEELGEVKTISRAGRVTVLEINTDIISQDLKVGDSVSVNGVCLTVSAKNGASLKFDALPQTLKITDLGCLKLRDKVNLERALKAGERLSGHFVTGHVDCAGIIRRKNYIEGNLCFEITFPVEYMNYILPKGSIAVDGISLTVVNRKSNTFTFYVIPHTSANTTLKFKGPSDKVNLEFDILAKKSNSPQ